MKIDIKKYFAIISSQFAWLVLIGIYLIGKILVSPTPIVYFQNNQLKTSFFKFQQLNNFQGNNVSFAILPWQMISAYATSLEDAKQTKWGSNNKDGTIAHIMGTDQLGRDQFAGFMNGFEIALLTGVCTALLAGIFALFFALGSAYFARFKIKVPWYVALYLLMAVVIMVITLAWWTIGIITGKFLISLVLFISLTCVLLIKLKSNQGRFELPFQHTSQQLFQYIFPIPDIILLAIISMQIQNGGIWLLILILSFFRIPAGAVYMKGVADTIVNEPYISQARSMGFGHLRIIWRHLYPGIRHQLGLWMALTAGRAILAESALSFLGIGPTSNYITWGSMINNSLHHPAYYGIGLACLAGILLIQILFKRIVSKI